MSSGRLVAEVAFGSNPADPAPRWEDVTPWVVAGKAKRGRSYELDRIEAGTASLTLDNTDGRFTPGRNTIATLSDHFNNVGAFDGTKLTTSESVWEHSGSTGHTGRTLTVLPGGGVRLDAVFTSAGTARVRMHADRMIPVVPGERFIASARVLGTGPGGNAYLGIAVRFFDASGALLTVVYRADTPALPGGQTLNFDFEIPTFPAGIAYACPEVSMTPMTAHMGALSLSVFRVSVERPSPYAGNVKPRKPVRVYTVHDDNWAHWEVVRPDGADLDRARFHNTTGTTVESVQSAALGRPVWQFTRNGDSLRTWYVGAEGDADWLRVEQGQAVAFSARVANVAGYGSSPTVRVRLEFRPDGGTSFGFAANGDILTGTGWQDASVSWTATGAGFVRAGITGGAADGNIRIQAVDLKMRRDNLGLPAVAAVSGLFPTFRGFIERWTQQYSGILPLVEVTAVDAMTWLSRPVPSFYRGGVVDLIGGYLDSYPGSQAMYWPAVEAAEQTETFPLVGDLSLRIVAAGQAAESYGFTTDKTMVWPDGAESGGFTVSDSNADPARGAVLQLSRDGRPKLPDTFANFTVDFWWKPEEFTTPTQTLFYAEGTETLFTVSATSTGAIQYSYSDPISGATSGGTGAGVVTTGVPVHIGATVNTAPGVTYVTLYINGSLTTLTGTPVGSGRSFVPPFTTVAFGGAFGAARTWTNGFRGTLNHCVLLWGPPDGFHQAAHPFGVDAPEMEGARLSRVLDAAGWPGTTLLDDSLSMLLGPRYDSGSDAAVLLSDAANSAGGDFFIGPAGEATYHNRQRRMGTVARWTMAEWTDGLRFEVDDSRVYNLITGERATGLTRAAEDKASQAEYGVKDLKVVRDVASPDEVFQAAAWLLHRYREARPRCDTLRVEAHTMNGANDAPLVVLAHGANMGDRVALTGLPVTAPADEWDFFVEGIEIDFVINGSTLEWSSMFSVSDAALSDAWILEDDTSGVLDTAACVAVY